MATLSAELPARYRHAVGWQKLNHTDVTPLLSAVWENQPDHVTLLLEDGAPVDAADGESGWTALHRALYYGNFRCAAALLAANAQMSLTDFKGRTALDLLSAELKVFMEHKQGGVVFSWGDGGNYQLGTGATGLQAAPVRLDALRKQLVVQIAAAKFHSAAVTKDGQLFTWGFGRGGRLGHPDFHVHSGESAIIVPRAVTGLGRRQVAVVAVAKHHTAVATTSFELFTWGSNRDGRLGYSAVDTQPTPRKVTSLKQRVVAVAAANKHTAILTDAGAIFSWGANDQGQLGYGTSDSASNAVPRQVEAMKGKKLVAVAAAKRHTMVMSSDGDIYTWGHRVVTPRRVQLAGARDVHRAGGLGDVAFHKGQSEISRPHAVAITAGVAHSSCLTRSGVVLAWRSWDANLAVQEVSAGLAGKKIVSMAAGKYRTAAVTDEGDVYMWEGLSKEHPYRKKAARDVSLPPRPDKAASRRLSLSDIISPERVEGLKRVSTACVGEKHSLALQCWCHSPKQLRLPILAAAAALPADSVQYSNADAEDSAELAAQAQEDAEWTAAADSSLGGATAPVAVGPPGSGSGEGVLSSGGWPGDSDGDGGEWLGREFWVGLENAHLKIQTAHAWAEVDFLLSLEGQQQFLLPESARLTGGVQHLRANEYYQPENTRTDSIPSLQRLCERSLAENAVEPRSCLQIMEYADACGAEVLKQFCLGIALSNLDTVLLEARGVLESMGLHLLAEMEDIQKAQFESASSVSERVLGVEADQSMLSRRPTAAVPGVQEGSESAETVHRRSSLVGQALVPSAGNAPCDLSQERSFCNPEDTEEAAAIGRQTRNLRKKLQQIKALEDRRQDSQLDPQQQAKLAQRAEVLAALSALQGGATLEEAHKAALSQRALSASATSSFTALHCSLSTLSMDSSKSHSKPKGLVTGKHKAAASRASRQALSEAVWEAGIPGLTDSVDAAGESSQDADSDMPEAGDQQPADQVSSSPIPTSSASGRLFAPASQIAVPTAATRQADMGTEAESASASAAKASAWGKSANSPVTSLRVSGFMTPLGHKADGPVAGFSPVGGSAASPALVGNNGVFGTPTSSGAGKKAKPPRKGGLSMFLSGHLEKASTPPPPPPPAPTPAAEFSWGGPRLTQSAQSLTSLRDIQNQEAAFTEIQRSGSQLSGLSSGWSKPSKQEGKDREGREQAVDSLFDRKRVPLEALVRKSSPIAMVKKEEPAEPQGPAWGGVVIGASPPGPEAEAGPQEAKPRLSDIQAEQERVRESCSRSFGAAGSSPASLGRDGFATYLQWRGGSVAAGPSAAGSSPGALFPAGTSPHTGKKMYTPSPQQNSKWYIKEERPVLALQDIQSEEYTRELQAQQEAASAAAAKLQAEEAAAAAAAQKALRKKQRQQKQARAKAAAQSRQQEARSIGSAQSGSKHTDVTSPALAEASSQPGVAPSEELLQAAVAQTSSAASNGNSVRSAGKRGSSGHQKAKANGQNIVYQPIALGGKTAVAKQFGKPVAPALANDANKPRILEVRRPKPDFGRGSADVPSKHASGDKANVARHEANPQEQQLQT